MKGEAMGKLQTTISEGGRDPDGYPFESLADYLYCDQCGSFRITTHISTARRLGFLLVLIGGVVLWHYIGNAFLSGLAWIPWWGLFLVLASIVLDKVWTYLGHKCRKW